MTSIGVAKMESMKCPRCGTECKAESIKETLFGDFWEYKCKCGFEWKTRKE